MSNHTKGVLMLALTALMWSTGGLFIKLIPANPVFIACIRSAFAGLIFIPFIKFRNIKISKSLVFLILANSFVVSGFVISTKYTTALNAIALQSTAPLWLYVGYLVFSGNPRKYLTLGKSSHGLSFWQD